MFGFRIINTPDGNQVIDTTLKTPYSALTAVQMVEYTEMDKQMALMERMERMKRREAGHRRKPAKDFLHKLASLCGIV